MIKEEQLKKIVGPGRVSQDADALAAYAGDISFVNKIKPAAVVKPANAQAVKELVKLAIETQTPLVPVSSGAPHFRGDTVPGIGGAIVVDLTGMKKILVVDRARRVAMVEVGVTFADLIPEAEKAGIRLNMPLLPKSTKSVVASMLEREPVVMPKYQWDVSDPMACMEIFFGSGDEFRTGQAAGPGTIDEQWKVGAMQKAPYGPGIASWHRLIQGAQGTMGIVTWASMRCELLPKVEEAFVVGSTNIEPLMDMAHWLVRLKMANECFILNNTNLAAIFSKKPADYQALKAKLPQWILFYVVAGYDVLPEERVASYVKDIVTVTKRLGLDALKSIGGISANQIMKAVQKPCEDPYWKLRYKGASEDVFYLTINDKLAGNVELVSSIADKAGYSVADLGVYIQPVVQGTSVHCEFNMFYNPENAADSALVKGLSANATKALVNQGAFFSRPYGEMANFICNRDAANKAVVNKLHSLFDPKGIMNPGKAGF
jgi:hypothetical protein